jgi:hypothetical protein
MRYLLVLLAIAAFASAARAEPSGAATPVGVGSAYVASGMELTELRGTKLGFFADGGLRLAQSPMFVRARVTAGFSGTDGDYEQVRAGLEARGCWMRVLTCAFAGIDGGFQNDHMVEDRSGWTDQFSPDGPPPPTVIDSVDAVLVPRVGLEMATRIRLRLGLDMPLVSPLDSEPASRTFAVSLGAARAF